MTFTANVVIGAGYGDEGKGLMTDYFCRKYDSSTLVVRFNGGAQAGHTVVTPDGRRHVFSHFGSGSFTKAATYLSDDFIVNPTLYALELQRLTVMQRINPTVFMSHRARITTISDMALNQCQEQSRSNNRHGSCGVGIFTTMQRHNKIPLTVAMLAKMNFKEVQEIVNEIQYYNKQQAMSCSAYQQYEQYFDTDAKRFYTDSMSMFEHIIDVRDDTNMTCGCNNFVFEGAQGLLLNEKYGVAPNLTPSDTGCETPVKICELNGIDNVDICFVSRIYGTRHGAGGFNTETTAQHLGLKNIENETNVKNEFQGSFRYGHLNVNDVSNAINKDYEYAETSNLKTRKILSITCLDQVDMDQDYWNNTISDLVRRTFPDNVMFSRGPTHETIF